MVPIQWPNAALLARAGVGARRVNEWGPNATSSNQSQVETPSQTPFTTCLLPLSVAHTYAPVRAAPQPGCMSELAQDFVRSCLAKRPADRPTISQLLRHPWIRSYMVSEPRARRSGCGRRLDDARRPGGVALP